LQAWPSSRSGFDQRHKPDGVSLRPVDKDNPLRIYWETMPPAFRGLFIPALFGLLFLVVWLRYT